MIVIGLALVAGCASGPRPGFDTSAYRVDAASCGEHKAARPKQNRTKHTPCDGSGVLPAKKTKGQRTKR